MLEVDRVSSGYGKLQVLDDVSLEAKPNQVTVIVGPNGSGKSTLLKTVAGLANIYQGTVRVSGSTISKLAPHEIARLGVAYLPQTEMTFTKLTVAENFKMAGYTISRQDFGEGLKKALEIFPRLYSYMDTKVSSLSGGERQMVAMTMALVRKSSVIMFDEPTANLAPNIAMQVLHTISNLSRGSGMTILLVEQNATRALQMGHYAYLFVGGRVCFDGPTKDLLEHKELGRLYLGLKAGEPAQPK